MSLKDTNQDCSSQNELLAEAAKKVFSALSKELGFIPRGGLVNAAKKKQLIVIDEVACVYFHIRKDEQITIYDLGVLPDYQGKGYGRELIRRVKLIAIAKGKKRLFAKCPANLCSNDFCRHIGFKLEKVEEGKNAVLNCWALRV